jgi:CheY-like chemotaxis protein
VANKYNEVTILLVDDDDVDALGVTRAFKKMRIINPLTRVKNGIEALEKLRGELSNSPVIVLLDLNMPIMNGFEFLQILRDDPELIGTIVFVLTTSKSDEDLLAAYNKSIAGYVVKSDLDTSFQSLTELLTSYWRVIEFPITSPTIKTNSNSKAES